MVVTPKVTVPPQPLCVPVPTVSPAGKVSLNATPLSAAGFAAGFVMVKGSCVVAPGATAGGLKALVIDGGPCTNMLAVAVPPKIVVGSKVLGSIKVPLIWPVVLT